MIANQHRIRGPHPAPIPKRTFSPCFVSDNLIAEGFPLRLALFALFAFSAFAQNVPLTLPAYDMFRYATAGRTFTYRFVPSGVAPFNFTVEEGASLPPGLRLNAATGELAGIVPQVGEYRTAVCVSDVTRAQICVPFLVIAVANEGDTYFELLPARVNMEYQNLVAKPGEFAEISYDPASGSLPLGMVLEITGRIYGIPRAPGGAWAATHPHAPLTRTAAAPPAASMCPILGRNLRVIAPSSRRPRRPFDLGNGRAGAFFRSGRCST